jgi:hypothetical protein
VTPQYVVETTFEPGKTPIQARSTAYGLRDTTIKVNSPDPVYTATDLNGHRGHQTIPEGAAEAVRLALLPDDGPTGTFSNRDGVVPS